MKGEREGGRKGGRESAGNRWRLGLKEMRWRRGRMWPREYLIFNIKVCSVLRHSATLPVTCREGVLHMPLC